MNGNLNILDFGADPLGDSDSYPAFVKLAAAVNAVGGGVILFPAGTYRIWRYRE